MDIIEYELTYLLKYLPKGLKKCKKTEVLDIYIPKKSVEFQEKWFKYKILKS